MAIQIKGPGKILILALVGIAVFFIGYRITKAPKKVNESSLVGKVVIPDAPEASLTGTTAVMLDHPSDAIALNGGLKIIHQEMAWQSQNNWHYANGGPRTTKGSLFDKAGLDLQIVRQDDCSKSVADMIKYINDYKNGSTKDGFMITFMGSGIANYMTNLVNATKDLGAEYQPIVFVSSGKSLGEDQVIGDQSFKDNPQTLRGKICRGYRLDGDLDVMIEFCGDNNVPVNPDETIWDPMALNLSYSATFLSAVVDYNNHMTETRHIVKDGKTTGKDTTIGIDLCATWTPGDVNAFNGRGGVTIISTKKYASMMPNITISCRKFLNDNRSKIDDLIMALAQAGDQIRSFDEVKRYTAKITTEIYDEANATVTINGKTYTGPDYWYQLYNGVSNGNQFMGGSMVFNLADMANLFGLNGKSDIYKEVYNTFGKLQSKLYPKDLPTFLEYQKAVDKSFMASVVSNHPELLEGKVLETKYADKITEVTASKSVPILFETGSSVINPSSYELLNEIYSSAVNASGMKVGIYGHTDNTGDADKNIILSAARAEAVKQYLIKKGLPVKAIESEGYGDQKPVESNETSAGRAKNRRVQVVLGS